MTKSYVKILKFEIVLTISSISTDHGDDGERSVVNVHACGNRQSFEKISQKFTSN